ncbi:MAG: YigZ family protein [Clostridiaceae bacterium]|nr:YigZ family protein [Clostridiaceae bacterium]
MTTEMLNGGSADGAARAEAEYITVLAPATATLERRRSIFHGDIAPVGSEDEAWAFLESIKARYEGARHFVYAWVTGRRAGYVTSRYSDAGEPRGTAGQPVLNVLSKNEITDAIIVVTRFFGGILLGRGGLTRAYSAAAAAALQAAEPVIMLPYILLNVLLPYAWLEKLNYQIEQTVWQLQEVLYGSDVTLKIQVPSAEAEQALSLIEEWTNGQAIGELTEITEYLPLPLAKAGRELNFDNESEGNYE